MPLTMHRAPSESAHARSKPSRTPADDQPSPVPETTAIALSTVRAFPLSAAAYAALRSARPARGEGGGDGGADAAGGLGLSDGLGGGGLGDGGLGHIGWL